MLNEEKSVAKELEKGGHHGMFLDHQRIVSFQRASGRPYALCNAFWVEGVIHGVRFVNCLRTGMVQEIMDKLRKLADQLDEDKWMYESSSPRLP